MYHPNPKRGCGRKQEGEFYAEAEGSIDGSLHLWTWVLGEGIDRGQNCIISPPPRKGIFTNPVPVLLTSDLYAGQNALINRFGPTVFKSIAKRVSTYAYFDHVGSSHYTPESFKKEVVMYGPSRRITKRMAKSMMGKLPMPIIFTHAHMPLFESIEHLYTALEYCYRYFDRFSIDKFRVYATWLDKSWSLYRNGHEGNDHAITAVLNLMDAMKTDWQRMKNAQKFKPVYQFFETVPEVEQVFGASWVTKITYVAKRDRSDEQDIETYLNQGINVLDLESKDDAKEI